ncbi:hypothetical protein Cni_G22683 [Canna indica]|uniref:Endonuclease/exonuclease/phosphatase domain-containing protein n=1 Tax=Canna indica TaxID=4628 RepID=A0AAQ3QLE4_9LILI|nr:hypothetical protein Cni_G22683 [Canna indica]
MDISIIMHEDFFINFHLKDHVHQVHWNVLAIHFHSDERIKHSQYDRTLALLNGSGPYQMVIGDFNAITSQDEKEGGRLKPASSIDGFNEFINKACLVDLGFTDSKFTWTNRSFELNLIRERLDRSLVSGQWRHLYPQVVVHHLDDNGSDHCPILVISNPILSDGQPFGYFRPTRGLRLGDPLSPYLFFVLCGRPHSLYNEEQSNKVCGVKISSACPFVSHLLFALDSILFCKANESHCRNLIDILQAYGNFSDQSINLNKSSIFFSHNTPQSIREHLAALLQVPNMGVQDKYLGLTSVVGRSERAAFNYVKENVTKKLHHWKRSLLSASEKAVLIKAVGSAILLYYLSCFRLLETLLEEIQNTMVSFWWGQKGTERKMHWIMWDTLCRLLNRDRTWKEDLIRRSFSQSVAKCILQIVPTEHEDRLIWAVEKNGVYTVASG